MNPIIATKTLDSIEQAMDKDGGNAYRYYEQQFLPLMDDAYKQDDGFSFRSHLGFSSIGHPCARKVWYDYRHVTQEYIEPRLHRLFNRGHLEEARMIALLKMIGCQVWFQDEKGNQFSCNHAYGHAGGSIDGVARGVPDHPEPVLTEFKTHSDKSFKDLEKKGVHQSKFTHYVQMVMYMGKFDLPAALYLAVNKNNDDIYAEMVYFDEVIYHQFAERAEVLVFQDYPPPRISNSPGWWLCKMCSHSPLCHGNKKAHVNCRSCVWAKPYHDGRWYCEHRSNTRPQVIDKERQKMACELYTEKGNIKE